MKRAAENKEELEVQKLSDSSEKTNLAVEVRGLKKGYGKGNARTEVLKGLDFEMESGDFCVIMGASGCGKSTLMSTSVRNRANRRRNVQSKRSGTEKADGSRAGIISQHADRNRISEFLSG